MRKLWPAAVLLASCAESSVRQDSVRESFEAWLRAVETGDAPTVVNMMTDRYRSEWLYKLIRRNDDLAAAWREQLAGSPRTKLDLWLYANERRRDSQIDILPAEVLLQPSLHQLFVKAIAQAYEIAEIFPRMRVWDVAVEGNNATITVKNQADTAEFFEMVAASDGWRINRYVPQR